MLHRCPDLQILSSGCRKTCLLGTTPNKCHENWDTKKVIVNPTAIPVRHKNEKLTISCSSNCNQSATRLHSLGLCCLRLIILGINLL